jgi:hypothetical protein
LKDFKKNLNEVDIDKMNSIQFLIDTEGVPPIFFENNFSIENKEMFHQIFPSESLKRPLLYQEKVFLKL